jgi:hypothetical protein
MQNVIDLVPVTPSIDQLARIIGNVAAPAFLLGALAAFISVIISRINRVIDRSQFIHGIGDSDGSRAYLKADLPRLRRRAELLNRSLFHSIISAILTALIIVVAFVVAFFRAAHSGSNSGRGKGFFRKGGRKRSQLPSTSSQPTSVSLSKTCVVCDKRFQWWRANTHPPFFRLI